MTITFRITPVFLKILLQLAPSHWLSQLFPPCTLWITFVRWPAFPSLRCAFLLFLWVNCFHLPFLDLANILYLKVYLRLHFFLLYLTHHQEVFKLSTYFYKHANTQACLGKAGATWIMQCMITPSFMEVPRAWGPNCSLANVSFSAHLLIWDQRAGIQSLCHTR